MKQRCLNPSDRNFKNYGGRGITVCERWRASFAAFLEDMGPRPPQGTLDRIDNDGPYNPSNCRWVDRRTQNLNTRRTITLTFKGRTEPLSRWADIVGAKYMTLYARYRRGLSTEEILYGR